MNRDSREDIICPMIQNNLTLDNMKAISFFKGLTWYLKYEVK